MPKSRTPEAAEALRASLIAHARRLVQRRGAPALTMRALAAEAGCALGLPYKVFASREELVLALIEEEFRRLRTAFDRWVSGAGEGTVAGNLVSYARLILDSPAVSLAHEVEHDPAHTSAVDGIAAEAGLIGALDEAVPRYLAAEKQHGRVDPELDEAAFGFLITGAIHNLLVSGSAYRRPSWEQLERTFTAVAAHLAPRQEKPDDGRDDHSDP